MAYIVVIMETASNMPLSPIYLPLNPLKSAILAKKLPENMQKQPFFEHFLIALSPHFSNSKGHFVPPNTI